ncbi:unnamed protein product [Rangifer tarandus platyrhynchus]|uniref:Basic proline-rich protein-like n=1 Tax=Rangifer tarandus platyrhynchus TaxID=3082113 RepID=A0ABN8YAS4_RANTA|nr:unnamed protein product [Rangifer tarandus platyrhynchus]
MSSPGGSFRSAAREQGAVPLAIASCGASAADPARARRGARSGGGSGGAQPTGGCQRRCGPPGPPPTAERPDRIADAGPSSPSRAAVLPPAPGLPGPRRRGERSSRALRAGRLPRLRAGPERGPARSSSLCLPLPLSAAPRVPRGWGFPSRSTPPPPPGPSPPPPAPMYVSPRAVPARPPARPPTFPPLQRGLAELRTRAALLKVSLSQHPRRPASDTGARGLRAPFSIPSPGRPGLRYPDAAAAATARGDLRTGRRQEEGCAAPAQSVSPAARPDPGLPAPGAPAVSPSVWD